MGSLCNQPTVSNVYAKGMLDTSDDRMLANVCADKRICWQCVPAVVACWQDARGQVCLSVYVCVRLHVRWVVGSIGVFTLYLPH